MASLKDLANSLRGFLSQVRIPQTQSPQDYARANFGPVQNNPYVRQIGSDLLEAGKSILKISPPGMVATQIQGMTQGKTGQQMAEERLGDLYKSLKGIGYTMFPVSTAGVGAGVGAGMNAVGNVLTGKPWQQGTEQAAIQGMSQGAALGPISKFNPLTAKAGQLATLPQRLTARIGSETLEGAAQGLIRPLQQGETRKQAIGSEALFGAGFGAAGAGLDELAKLPAQAKKKLIDRVIALNPKMNRKQVEEALPLFIEAEKNRFVRQYRPGEEPQVFRDFRKAITGNPDNPLLPQVGFQAQPIGGSKAIFDAENKNLNVIRKGDEYGNMEIGKAKTDDMVARERFNIPELTKVGGKNLLDPEFRNIYNESKQAKKKYGDTDKNTMYGAVAGIETYYDEEDKQWKVRYDPVKGAAGLGVGLMFGGLKSKGGAKALFDAEEQAAKKFAQSSIGDVTQRDIESTYGKLLATGDIGRIKAFEKKYLTKGTLKPLSNRPLGKLEQKGVSIAPNPLAQTTPQSVQPANQTGYTKPVQNQQALDTIIAEGRKQIASSDRGDKRSISQAASDFYTQWVDRFNPIVQASNKAKAFLKIKGAELRPEHDPAVLVRRLTGAGGIADYRFKTQLEPIIKQSESLGINKLDLDTYLAHKRMAGFGQVGRDIYGTDPIKSQQIVDALEVKYGQNIKQVADQLYQYQDKGFKELVDSGFLSPEDAKLIQSQNPDYAPLYRKMDEINDYLGLPTRKTMQGSQPVKKIEGSTRQIESPLESIIGNTFSQRAAIEKNRVSRSIVGLSEIMPDIGFKKVTESGGDTITVWNNGKKEYWSVGQDIADVAKGANEENMNMILKIMQAPASLLRQGATGRNPEFMIPNIIRDQLDAGITSKYGYIPFVDYISGMKSILSNDSIYQKWQSSGAKIDLGELSGKKSIQQYFDEKKGKKNLLSWLGAGLDWAGKWSEQPTRVGLFKKAFQKTGNEMLSLMESRDATVDFARMGSKMKVANSIIPFLNVGVQGFDKLIRSVKNNPGKVLLNAGMYGASPAIATAIYNMTNFPEEYSEIPQYEKDSNFILIKGRNEKGTVDYLAFPKGNVLPVIANPIQSFLEFAYSQDKQSFREMATSLLSETLPVLSGGSTPKEVAVKTIGSNLPQLVKPLAETLFNKSFYKYDPKKQQSKDIVPFYLQNKPAYEQKYEWTPKMYQAIGTAFNVSPLQVQNLMEGYLAGYTKIPSQMVDMLSKVSRGEPVDTNQKTILRRFIKETYPNSGAGVEKPKPEVPGFMERVFGKASAAGKTETTDEEKRQKDLQNRDKLRYSKDATLESDGKIYIKKDTESGISIDTIDPSFMPKKPELTGMTELDKKAMSKFSGEVTQKANDIYKLYEIGKISGDEAEKQLTNLKAYKDSVKGTGTGKRKGKKITLKKISAKPIRISLPKTQSMGTVKISKPPKYKQPKTYKPIKISSGKKIIAPKLTGLTAARRII